MALQVFYKIDEGTGTAIADSSGNGYNGTTSGSPVWSINYDGTLPALVFDGTDDHIVPNSNVPFTFERTSPFSITAWIKVPSEALTRAIAGKLQSGSPFRGWMFYVTDSGQLRLHLTSTWSTNVIAKYTTATVTDDTWHHVAFTYSGSSLASGVKFYIDGAEATLTTTVYDTLNATIQSASDAYVGRVVGGSYFKGIMDEFRLYNTALTGNEVNTLYEDSSGSISALMVLNNFELMKINKLNIIG